MGNLVFQAALGGQVAVSGPNTASSYTINVPTVNGTFVTTGDTGTVTTTMLASTTGSGAVVLATSPTLVTPALGTPSSVTLTNATGLPISTGLSGLTTNGVAYATSTTALATGSGLVYTGSNLGVGTSSPQTTLQVGPIGNIGQDVNTLYVGANFTGSYGTNYITSNYAVQTYFDQSTGNIVWKNAGSGTAGNAISWTERMRLDNSGTLLLGSGVVSASSNGGFNVNVTQAGSSSVPLALQNQSTSNGSGVYLAFRGKTSGGAQADYNYIQFVADSTSANTSSMRFYSSVGSGPTEAMRIDTGGALLVGTNNNGWTSYGGFSEFRKDQNSRSLLTISNQNSGSSGAAGILFAAYGNSWINTIGTSANNSNALTWSLDATSPSEKMRLDNSGNLLVRNTNRGGQGTICPDGIASLQPAIACYQSATSSQEQITFRNPNAVVGSITTSGTTTLYNVTSDQRLKTNIVDAPNGNIDEIKIRSFDWKADNSHTTYGVIAQELFEIAPYAVYKPNDENQMMAVDYSKLVPMMIKEIQSLKQRILTLENK